MFAPLKKNVSSVTETSKNVSRAYLFQTVSGRLVRFSLNGVNTLFVAVDIELDTNDAHSAQRWRQPATRFVQFIGSFISMARRFARELRLYFCRPIFIALQKAAVSDSSI